jgi:hypothetical protein
MRNKFFVLLGVAATLTLAACSSSNEGKPTANANPAPGVNAPVTATSSNSGNSNTNLVADGTVAAPQAGDANVASSDAAMPGVLSPQMQNRFDKAQRNGMPSGPPVDAAALAMKLARPAPDNSTFTSYLTDAGYEIRTFKDHPQLKKVEKKTTNDGTVSIKVYLRNGKVIDLPGQAIPNLSGAPAILIMDAAGLPSSPPTTAASGPPKGKKPN